MTILYPGMKRIVKGRLNPPLYAVVCKALTDGPHNIHELCEISGANKTSVASFLRSLKTLGLIHIGGWDPDPRGAQTRACFVWGYGTDKPRATKSKDHYAQKARKYRANLKLKALQNGLANKTQAG